MSDFRFGLRMLARNPGSTALIAGLLALGIGSCSAVFGLFDAVLLQPLAVRHPEELVRMVQHLPKLGARSSFPYAYYEALRDHSRTLTLMLGETDADDRFRMTNPEPAEEISVQGVTPEFFQALGVQALYGRVLQADDTGRNSGLPPAVLSYGFWQRRFGGDLTAVRGRSLTLNGYRFLIVGVMPRDFNGLAVDTTPDLRIPLNAFSLLVNSSVEATNLELAGRLRPDSTRAQAAAECLSIWQSTMKDYYRSSDKHSPEAVAALLKRGMDLEPLARGVSVIRERFSGVLKLVMASMGLLVLMVCANVAGLLLARGSGRQQEFAVRMALGATRARVARQLVVESSLLAILGAGGGLLVALITTPLVVRLVPPMRDLATNPIALSLHARIDGRVFLFLMTLSVLTAVIFAVGPALASSRFSLDRVLRTARASASLRLRHVLIAFEIALCTFLLAEAGLLVRTFQHLRNINPGFNGDDVATFTADLGGEKGAKAYVATLLQRIRAIPGVVSAATSSTGVMRGHGLSASVAPAGQRIDRSDFMNANVNLVSSDYFATMGIRMLAGRDFLATHSAAGKPGIPTRTVVNEAFARRFFPNTNPLGKRFGMGVEGTVAPGMYEIAGVVSDSKYRSLREPIRSMFYRLDNDFDSFVLNVRTRVRPEAILEPVRKAAASIAPGLPFLEVHTLAAEMAESTAPERTTAALASLFGAMAVLLGAVGIYGLLAYVVTQRRREIGIRMALGASASQVAKLIAGQTLVMTSCGLAVGLTAALLAGPAFRALLYGVSPEDPASLVAAAVLIVMVALAAAVVPAVDAAQVDPAETLRLEN